MKLQTVFRDAPIALRDRLKSDRPQPLLGSLTITPEKISLQLDDGRVVWIEVEDGQLHVRSFLPAGVLTGGFA